MSNQPEALRLAALWEKQSHGYALTPEAKTAAELRRLHAENKELRRCAEVEEVEKYAAANRRLYALNGELLEALRKVSMTAVYVAKGECSLSIDVVKEVDAVVAKVEGQA
jgi:hypothetical protein